MTQPLHARDIKGKGRHYGTCGEPACPFGDDLYLSVTNAQSIINKPALPPSAAKITAEHAWELLPQMVATSRQMPDGGKGCDRARVADRCGTCRFCVTSRIKAQYKEQWESKADFGTLVHTYAHAHVTGRPMPPDPTVGQFIAEYVRFLEAWDVDIERHVEAAETTILHRRHGYAGTGDIWIWLPLDPATGRRTIRPGKRWLWLVDIKTSLTKPVTSVYPDQVLQLAGLRYAETAVLVDDSEIALPKFAGAALLNLRGERVDQRTGEITPPEHALIPLPADRAAHAAFVHAVALQRFFLNDVDTRAWEPVIAVPATPTAVA